MLPIDNIIEVSNSYLEHLGEEQYVKSLQGSFKGWKGAMVLIAAYDYAKPGVLDVQAKRALKEKDGDPQETIDSVIKLLSEEFGVPEYVDSSQLMNPDKKCIRMYMSEVKRDHRLLHPPLTPPAINPDSYETDTPLRGDL